VAAALALALGWFWLRQRQIASSSGLSSFPLDDPWIHLQFARNLAEGHGFAYNPGVPVGGSTAPLWTLVLAAAFAAFGSQPVLAKALGALAVLGASVLARQLAWRWTQHRAVALIAGLATATTGPLVWGALSGMEVALAALLVTGALAAYAAGRDATAALLLAVSALARPEASLLIPLCWLARPITWRRTAITFGAAAACLTPWALFNLTTTGTPLPATAAAKIEGGLLGFLTGTYEPLSTALLGRPWQFTVEWVQWLGLANILLPIAIPLGLWALWRKFGRAALPAAVLILHPLGMALLAPFRGPGFQEGRYSIQLLPLAIVVAIAGLYGVMAGPRIRALAGVLFLAASVAGLGPAASRYGWAVQNIDAMQVHLGRWVTTHTPPEALIGLNDVGAIAYVSRREVVDLMGLVTPAIIPYRRAGEIGVLHYLERACPDYLIIFPAWFPTLAAMSDRFVPIYRVRLDHNTVSGADEMVVYETKWNRWRPAPTPCAKDGRRTIS